MDTAAVSEMLRRDHEEWEALAALLDTRRSGPVHDPDPSIPQDERAWEARHVYAHFARWINHSTDDFEAVLAGRERPPAPEGDDDAVNARWRAEDDAVSFEEARRRAREAFDRREAAIRSVPAARWNPLLDEIARADGYRHISGHTRYIEAG